MWEAELCASRAVAQLFVVGCYLSSKVHLGPIFILLSIIVAIFTNLGKRKAVSRLLHPTYMNTHTHTQRGATGILTCVRRPYEGAAVVGDEVIEVLVLAILSVCLCVRARRGTYPRTVCSTQGYKGYLVS